MDARCICCIDETVVRAVAVVMAEVEMESGVAMVTSKDGEKSGVAMAMDGGEHGERG